MTELKEYRGHIRNWSELCTELGISPQLEAKEREREIIKAGYEKWGADIAEHLYGMFAFALYDSEKDEIFCLRDHFGTKPFYYYITEDNKLLYGTYIKDIISKDSFKKELNEKMLQLYLTFTYVAGEETFFKGVKKLMPGHYLIFKDGKLTIKRYWTPTFKPDDTKTLEDWANEIHSTLKAVMPQVKTDDEKADSFLSGGVDSSYVLAMSDAETADSCGYDDERFDESKLAAKTAEMLGRKHSVCKIRPEQFFDNVPYVMK
ncbi:MAG: asparagine synthetase B, partial [Firmicutes bacterium]|nr:asparagine synthetase B [Bacillota bacterium]